MTLERIIDLLRAHEAALRSSEWTRPHGPSAGPALYLDLVDTRGAIAELTRVGQELRHGRSAGDVDDRYTASTGGRRSA